LQENKKILVIVSGLMLTFLFVIIAVVIVNFRNYSLKKEYIKAETIASLVKDGLTAHMASGTMAQRELFIDNATKSSKAQSTWIFRTDKVVQLFGEGFAKETIRDDIDKKMIKTAKIQEVLNDSLIRPTIRITIPYIATSNSNPNCLNCHTNAKEGEVLGGISMVFDVADARLSGLQTILKILGIAFIFIVIFIFIANRFFKPYIGALVTIKESLKKANEGDYRTRIEIKGDSESTEVFKWMNSLLEKLEKTIGAIDKNISLFVADRRQKFHDPLEKSQFIIEDIGRIYKFKRTIEQDTTKEVIYKRLIKIFKEQLKLNDISLYEVDIKRDKRVLIYDDTPEQYCSMADEKTSERCRAYRTNSIILSDDFENICQSCDSPKEYLCINYPIDENVSLVINIKPKDKEKLFENKKSIGYIKNYLESARPVLQSKILTEILQKSNMIDGLTKLFNRKFLNIFMDTTVKEYRRFAVAMVDIDFFKKVNDTYGHDAGDVVLKGLSKLFKKSIGKEDMVFRFGGEEFLIFISNVEDAKAIAEKIRKAFEESTFNVNGQTIKKTLSVGVAIYPQDNNNIWGTIKCSDIALYEAKDSGRNRVVMYENVKDKTKDVGHF